MNVKYREYNPEQTYFTVIDPKLKRIGFMNAWLLSVMRIFLFKEIDFSL